MIERLRSFYYVLFKHYYLIWREYDFPREKLVAHLLVYDNVIVGNFDSQDIPKEVIDCLKSHIKAWEERNEHRSKE